MAYSAYTNPKPDYQGLDADSLTPIRRQVLFNLLPLVVPSTEGDEKFDLLMTHKKCQDQRDANPHFTTCGSLPGWLFSRLGLHKSLANYGLAGVRDAAMKLGCWVRNDELGHAMYESAYHQDQRPLPGDVYLLANSKNSQEIMHIGVIVNPTGTRWWTADSGQGKKEEQQALYVPRLYQPATRQLDGENYGVGTGRPPRRLIGWVDLERAQNLSS
jgi:hypothetical protein